MAISEEIGSSLILEKPGVWRQILVLCIFIIMLISCRRDGCEQRL